jgi:tellurium resistance protein TerD
MVANAYVRVVDKTTGQEINRFELTDYYSNVTSMVVGELYRYNGAWKFNAVGDGVARDLAGLCEMYGVNVAD